jgi:hypothetical protein
MSIALSNKDKLYSAPLSFDGFTGVVGDGVNDDTAGMQAAINAAPAGSVLRGTPGKTYYFTSLSTNKTLCIDFQGANLRVAPGVASLVSATPALKFQSTLASSLAINTATAGADNVTLTASGGGTSFAVDDWVQLRDVTPVLGWDQGIGGVTSNTYSERLEVNRIIRISGDTLYFQKPIEWGYDSAYTATATKISSPIVKPKIINVGTVTEDNPGGNYTGSSVTGPHIFAFFHCIEPMVDGATVDGWQLHIVQFSKCYKPVARRVSGTNPFRPSTGGHGYVVQFERSSNGLAELSTGFFTRHLVDHTQSYDCLSRKNTAFSPRTAQFAGHGQGAKRMMSVDDTVYMTQDSGNGVGWSMGNSGFNADYGYTIVRPTLYASAGLNGILALANSEDLLVIEPRFVIAKSSATAFNGIQVNSGTKRTKVRGGVIDMRGSSGASSDSCIRTLDKTQNADLVGIDVDSIEMENVTIYPPTQANTFGVSLNNVVGVVKTRGVSLVGTHANCNGFDLGSTCAVDVLDMEATDLSGTFVRGLRTLAAPTVVYRVLDTRLRGTFSTFSQSLTASDLLVSDEAVGVVLPGDAAVTVTTGTSAKNVVYDAPITADRAVALSTSQVWPGAQFRVTRAVAATGAFNVNVGTGPLKALAAGTWCEVTYNGSAWVLTAYGAL